MFEFNKYDRIIIIKNTKITHLVTSNENLDGKIIPASTSEKTLAYLNNNIFNNNTFNDLLVFHIDQSIDGFNLLNQVLNSEDFEKSNSEVIVLAENYLEKEKKILSDLGVENLISDKNAIDNILKLLTDSK